MQLVKQVLCLFVVALIVVMPIVYLGTLVTIAVHFLRKFW